MTPAPYLIAKAARNTLATASVSATTVTARMLQTSARSTKGSFSTSTLRDSSFSSPTQIPKPRFISYKYPFPSIPRPRRNMFYYYNPMPSIKRGLSSIPQSSPGKFVRSASRFTKSTNPNNTNTMSNRYNTFSRINYYGKRFASSAAGSGKNNNNSRKATSIGMAAAAKSWKWWAVPAVTIIIWTAIRRQKQKQIAKDQADGELQPLLGEEGIPKPAKPWQVAAYSTLPLKAMSRLWGRVNDITLPIWMREPGFKLYSYFFGVNLDEVAEEDLKTYRNLGEFFFRELKPGSRIIDPDSILVSPADGQVLHLGVINDRKVEQVKGITYSLDALLGGGNHHIAAAPSHEVDFELHDQQDILERHKEFAVMNGISYTLDKLIGGGNEEDDDTKIEDQGDATLKSVNSSTSSFVNVSKDVLSPDFTPSSEKELFFAVIYLAPGDYHRFHSPANWVTEIRRHFVGELYSVAPYFQSRLQGLFVLNERVALLGRWKHGFFSMTPVGATNVGSILIHFDKNLQTNTVYEHPSISTSSSSSSISSLSDDVASTSSAEQKANQRKKVKKATCYEATYARASRLLGGYPLSKGEQMGGFNLGSTVVLVFEAPKSFQFNVKAGDRVKVGQALGNLP